MIKAFKYRLYPTKEQEKILAEWQGQLRFVWNQFLNLNIQKYESEKKFVFKYEMANSLPILKKQYPWISAPGQSLQKIAFRLDQALKNKFKSNFGFPRFKKRGFESGIYIPQGSGQIKIGPKFIKIPKLGELKWVRHREMEGPLKSITITRDIDQWYVSCLCDTDLNITPKEITCDGDITGIDLGIKEFLFDSNGVVVDSPKFLKKSEKKLVRKQKQYSKKKKGSANQKKAKTALAKAHRKVRFQRRDFLHKLSAQIANENSVVVIEDLAVKNMVRNHKLAKAISDQGWSQFVGYLEYKLTWAGGQLIKIGRFAPSSQICSGCGSRQKISLSVRTYICPVCGLTIDRDYNAALNIKAYGLARLVEQGRIKILETNTAGIAGIYACGNTSSGDLVYAKSSYVLKNRRSEPSSEKQEAPTFRSE